jgi:FkbM family methyltransferase
MLWRAFRDKKSGFYIDVGANHPQIDSVTKSFYDRGWRGINIEPVDSEFDLLVRDRARDINLKVAVGRESGSIPLYSFPGTGLSTLSEDNAQSHVKAGHVMEECRIPVLTLAEICREHDAREFEFLKIDVEGWEREVLLGADFKTFRPQIVLVESTLPGLQESNHHEWEPILTEANYHFVWFDGLNRFYVSGERVEAFGGFFKLPPNIFDGFVSQSFAAASRAEEHWLRSEWNTALLQRDGAIHERDVIAAERDWLRSECDAATTQKEGLSTQIELLTQERDWLKSEWDVVRAQVDSLKAEGVWLRSEWDASAAQVRTLAAEGVQLRKDIDAGLTRIQSLEAACEALQSAFDAQLIEKDALRAEYDRLVIEHEGLKIRVAMFSQHVEAEYRRMRRSLSYKLALPLRWLRIQSPLRTPAMPGSAAEPTVK